METRYVLGIIFYVGLGIDTSVFLLSFLLDNPAIVSQLIKALVSNSDLTESDKISLIGIVYFTLFVLPIILKKLTDPRITIV